MLDIEANVSLQVASVKRGVKALRDLAARTGGVVTSERVDTSSRYGSAELTLRVPSRATQGVFEELESIGSVLNQTVTARDIGKQFFDANLRLSSLNATLQRYEEILSKATKVEEILRIEQELARLRTEIEQVKGDLRWLSDRAARATLNVTLRERAPEVVYTEEPESKFFPGLRAPLLLDLGRQETRSISAEACPCASRAASAWTSTSCADRARASVDPTRSRRRRAESLFGAARRRRAQVPQSLPGLSRRLRPLRWTPPSVGRRHGGARAVQESLVRPGFGDAPLPRVRRRAGASLRAGSGLVRQHGVLSPC